MNNISISGRLVYEPEIKFTNNQTPLIRTRIAVNRNDKNKTVDFFNVQFWSKTAEFVNKYFSKGDPIEITGHIEVQNYTKSDGTNVSEVVIVASGVNFCLTRNTDATDARQTREDAPETTHEAPTVNEPDYSGAGLPFEI